MPTLIDSLVVGMGLEGKAFVSGSKTALAAFKATGKEAQATANEIEARGKQAALFFSRLRNEALTFFAVFTAGVGLKDFIGNTISGAASLGRMSANLKMSTRELNAWQKANERAGGTSEGISAQLKESQLESAKYGSGIATPAALQAFAKYGGNFEAFKDGNTYLLERSRIISELYAKSPARAALAAQELGINEDTYNLIKQGPAAIQALIAAQLKNSVVTEKDAAQADQLRTKLLDLRDSLQATATKVLLTMAPVLEKWLAQLQELADWVTEHRKDISDWVEAAVRGMLQFAKALDGAAESVGGWKVVIGSLIALKLGSMVAQFVALGVAIAGVGKAAAGTAATGGLFALLRTLGVGGALLLHSGGLNEGEQEELARRRALGDKGPVFTGTRAPLPSASDAQNQIMDSLMAKGWTRAQAAGIAANLQQESNFNPGAVGDGGKAYGIAQWHGPRQKAFREFHGKDIRGSTLEEQLEFLDYELRNAESGAGDRLKKTTTAGEAGAVISKYYERPADTDVEMIRRAHLAAGIDNAEKARMAAWAAANAEGARNAGAGRGFVNPGGNTSTSEIHIGEINVSTQATDAEGIARELPGAIRKTGIVAQANTGLQ
jgi:tail lysozyme